MARGAIHACVGVPGKLLARFKIDRSAADLHSVSQLMCLQTAWTRRAMRLVVVPCMRSQLYQWKSGLLCFEGESCNAEDGCRRHRSSLVCYWRLLVHRWSWADTLFEDLDLTFQQSYRQVRCGCCRSACYWVCGMRVGEC